MRQQKNVATHPGDGMFTMGATVAQQIATAGTGTFLSLSLGEKGHNTIPTEDYGLMHCGFPQEVALMTSEDPRVRKLRRF